MTNQPNLVYHLWQTAPNNGWSDSVVLGDKWASIGTVAVALNQAGVMEVVGLGTPEDQSGSAAAWHIYTIASSWMTDWWSWYPLYGLSSPMGMPDGVDGNFMAISSTDDTDYGGNIVRWNGNSWSQIPLPDGLMPNCLAVDQTGTAWVIAEGAAGSFFRIADGAVQQIPAALPSAFSIAANSASGIWALAQNPNEALHDKFVLSRFTNGAWQLANSPNLYNTDWWGPPQLAAGRDGSIWVMDPSGNVWRQEIGPPRSLWDPFPARAGTPQLKFLTAAPDGNAWAIDGSGAIWHFDNMWMKFNRPLPKGQIAQVSFGVGGTIWAIDTEGNPYKYSAQIGWQSRGIPLQRAARPIAHKLGAAEHRRVSLSAQIRRIIMGFY